jgi:hypothetical protein
MGDFILASIGLVIMCYACYLNLIGEPPKWLTFVTSAYTGFTFVNWCCFLTELFY